MSKQRIIELQKQLRISRSALERISYGILNPESLAADALDEMRRLDAKYPLQVLVGHERKPRQ
jgi:hypothetical protein